MIDRKAIQPFPTVASTPAVPAADMTELGYINAQPVVARATGIFYGPLQPLVVCNQGHAKGSGSLHDFCPSGLCL